MRTAAHHRNRTRDGGAAVAGGGRGAAASRSGPAGLTEAFAELTKEAA
jgi:hypothetical protein